MSEPRSIEARIDWFLSNNPSDRGMCAQHTWHSLGGDYGNPPAWGASDANECVDKVKASGRYWTPGNWSGPPPRGAWVGYKYGNNGHACLSLGDGRIATTDPSSGAMVGIEDLDYPNKWGASGWDVWTDEYNGVRFDVAEAISDGDVYLSKLKYGQMDSDSVKRLQDVLNGHTLEGGQDLPISGNYLDETDEEVRLCQAQHGFGTDPAGASFVGSEQADHLFGGSGHTVIDDISETTPPPEPEPTPPDPPAGVTEGIGFWDWYSGKETNEVLVYPDGEWHDIKIDAQPASGISGKSKEEHFLYLRIHLPKGRTVTRTVHTRFVRSNGDETAYKSPAWPPDSSDSVAYENFHVESGSGLGGKWQIMVEGGTDPLDYTTRYAKTYVTYRS